MIKELKQMSRQVDPAKVATEGFFTVSRVRPVKDEDGSITLATCGCGCSGSVSVSNTRPLEASEAEVLVLKD